MTTLAKPDEAEKPALVTISVNGDGGSFFGCGGTFSYITTLVKDRPKGMEMAMEKIQGIQLKGLPQANNCQEGSENVINALTKAFFMGIFLELN